MKTAQLAEIMINLSHQIVWPAIQEICQEHNTKIKHPFMGRVGSGARTYHIIKVHNHKKHHVVTYGKKMLEDKLDQNRAEQWLTGIEIVEKKFFDGVVSYKNLVAHTILHEMAHALQTIMGDRTYKSVHNKAFYQWLRLLHQKCGDNVVEQLENMSAKKNIALDFKTAKTNDNQSELRPKTKSISNVTTPRLKVNKIYQCYLKRESVLVRLDKINRKRLHVTVVEKGHAEAGKTYSIVKHILEDAPDSKIIKNRMDLNFIEQNPLDISKIKMFKKYKIELKKVNFIVQVTRKNKETVVVEVLEGHDSFIGNRWKVPAKALQEM
jgi:hypothetical protein